MNTKNNELPFNKTNFMNLKKERDMLKITLEYISKENENLKNELNDMKITAKKNKDMLKEYVYQITNKDKLFEKMTSTIEQLKSRLKAIEQSKKEKKKYIKDLSNDLINYNTNNRSTTTNSNNYTTNNIISTNGRENNLSFGFNILNDNNIKINKKSSLIEINNNNKSSSNIIKGNNVFNILKKNYNENNLIKKEINNVNNKNENKNENNNYKIDMKYFLDKQKNIMEEIDNIKDDIQFLMENKSKSLMKEKLNQSIAYNNSLNSSFCSDQRNNDNNISFTSEKSLENSYLSNLSITYNGPDPNILRQLNYNLNISQQNNNIHNLNLKNEIKKNTSMKNNNYNLKIKYLINENFSSFISKINIKKDLLFLIDGKNNVWELIKRGDLSIEQFQKYEDEKKKENRIKSILDIYEKKSKNDIMNILNNGDGKKNYSDKDENENLLDIKIKEPTDFLFK